MYGTHEKEILMSIYNRQETLNYNTDQSFVVCGAGGIGYWVVKFLAMAGVKNITVFDPDFVEESNLNRLDYTIHDIGRNKAELLKWKIKEIRPSCKIESYPFKFKKSFIVDDFDWFVDCTDDFSAQKIHEEIAKQLKVKYVKPGYNGESITISNTIPTWVVDDTSNGYTITPSFVAPAVIVAGLVVSKTLKYFDSELSTNLHNLYN